MAKDKKRRDRILNAINDLSTNYAYSKFVYVNDDWSPNYPNNQIKVSIKLIFNPISVIFYVRIIATGLDDTKVYRDWEYSTLEASKHFFAKHKKIYDNIPQVVNQRWFLDRGFEFL